MAQVGTIVHYAPEPSYNKSGDWIRTDFFVDNSPAPNPEEFPDISYTDLQEAFGLDKLVNYLAAIGSVRTVHSYERDMAAQHKRNIASPAIFADTPQETATLRRERDNARKREWAKNNREYMREYYKLNKDHMNAQTRQRRLNASKSNPKTLCTES